MSTFRFHWWPVIKASRNRSKRRHSFQNFLSSFYVAIIFILGATSSVFHQIEPVSRPWPCRRAPVPHPTLVVSRPVAPALRSSQTSPSGGGLPELQGSPGNAQYVINVCRIYIILHTIHVLHSTLDSDLHHFNHSSVKCETKIIYNIRNIELHKGVNRPLSRKRHCNRE